MKNRMKVPRSTCHIGREPATKCKRFDSLSETQQQAIKLWAYNMLVGENRCNVGTRKRSNRKPPKDGIDPLARIFNLNGIDALTKFLNDQPETPKQKTLHK